MKESKSQLKRNIAFDLAQTLYNIVNKNNSIIDGKIDVTELLEILSVYTKELENRGRLNLLPEIIERFKELLEGRISEKTVFVISAVQLDEATKQELQAKLIKRFGNDIKIDVKVDEKVLGGIIVRYQDKVIDLSLDSQLDQLIK